MQVPRRRGPSTPAVKDRSVCLSCHNVESQGREIFFPISIVTPTVPARECERPEMVSTRRCPGLPSRVRDLRRVRLLLRHGHRAGSKEKVRVRRNRVVACSSRLILVALAHCLRILPGGEGCGGQQSVEITNTSSSEFTFAFTCFLSWFKSARLEVSKSASIAFLAYRSFRPTANSFETP